MLKFFRTHWRLTLLGLGILLLCVFFFPGTPTTKGTQISRDASLEKLGIVAQSWVDASAVEHGDSINYSLVIYNTGSTELQDLCASLNAPGFSGLQNPAGCFANVPAGTSANFSGRFKAISRSGQYRITASYQATRQSLIMRSAISAGPIEVNGWFGQAMWVRFVRRLALLAKDLALPLVLTGLGLLFQRWQVLRDAKDHRLQAQRDRKARAMQDKRDQENQDAQTVREQRQEVRNIILPFVHALAEKHYMPIVRSAVVLMTDYGRWRSEADASAKEKYLKLCFYDFVVILKRMTYLRKDKGQVFFQNRQGEAIVSSVWTIARNQCQSVFGEDGISALTLVLAEPSAGRDATSPESIDIDYAAFAGKLPDRNIDQLFVKFSQWITQDDFARFLNLMNVLQAVFAYESNRPFNEHWYEDSKIEELEFTRSLDPWPADFPQIDRDFPRGPQHSAQLERLRRYLAEYTASTKSKQS